MGSHIFQDHKFADEIIRAYDIRGIFGNNLKSEDAFFLGLKLLQARKNLGLTGRVSIGYDGRISSPTLHKALISSFQTQNIEIIDLGLVPTPLLYFAANFLANIDIAIMITGSHNPSHHNGFKIILNKVTLFGNDLKNLANLKIQEYFHESKLARVTQINIETTYINKLISLISKTNNLKVVWDPSNGAACNLLTKLILHLPGQHQIINGNVDGNFPAHNPDPSQKENLQQLISEVKSLNYDFGIAFDGDADRLGIVDNTGNILFGSHLLYIFAADLLTRQPGATILTDVKMSNLIIEALKTLNCNLIQYKTGHALIKEKMKTVHAMLAAEMSGHIFFTENYYGFDDAIFGACKFLEIAYHNPDLIKKSLSITAKVIPIQERKLAANNSRKNQFINFAKKLLLTKHYHFTEIDGLRVDLKTGWFLIKASNTEDTILLTGEAFTKQAEKEINQLFNELDQH